jgi:hypothetical protein
MGLFTSGFTADFTAASTFTFGSAFPAGDFSFVFEGLVSKLLAPLLVSFAFALVATFEPGFGPGFDFRPCFEPSLGPGFDFTRKGGEAAAAAAVAITGRGTGAEVDVEVEVAGALVKLRGVVRCRCGRPPDRESACSVLATEDKFSLVAEVEAEAAAVAPVTLEDDNVLLLATLLGLATACFSGCLW